MLSLNVALDELLVRHNFNFAAVYSPGGQLLAQSGKRTSSLQTFTRDINFQDANLGYVLIELDPGLLQQRMQRVWVGSLVIHGLIALLTAGIIWFYGDMVYLWVTLRISGRASIPIAEDVPQHPETEINRRTLLVIKIRPSRLVPVEGIIEAARLYEGELETASDEEWLVTFDTRCQLSNSLRCGLLIREITMLQTGKLHFKAGIDSASSDDLSMLRKQASYLASVSKQNLVVSERVNREIQANRITNAKTQQDELIPAEIKSHPFHSSLTGDGEVYVVEGQ